MDKKKLFNNDLTEEIVCQAIRENLIIAASLAKATYSILNKAEERENLDSSKLYIAVAEAGKNTIAFVENAERLVNLLNKLED